MTEVETVLLGVIELQEAKRLRAAMLERGVELELRNNPETCSTGGCAPSVEVRARLGDVERFRELVESERSRSLDGLEIDASRLESVFDTSAAEAQCPACGTRFSTLNRECPDCGLVFVVEE
jgi:ribosomal protein S27E